MQPRLVKPPGQDFAVERLKSRYGLRGCRPAEYAVSNFDQAKCKRSSLTSPDDLDLDSSGDKGGSLVRWYSDERQHSTVALHSSSQHLSMNRLGDELDSLHNSKQWEAEEELIENDHRASNSKITKQSFKEVEKAVASPTNLASKSRNWTECCSDAGDPPLKRVGCPTSDAPQKQSPLPHQLSQVYGELLHIHRKLQCETAAQQEFAEELQRRERYLLEREQLLFRHEAALSKMRGVEEEVLTRFQVLKEQHDAEVLHLTEVLKEKNKESRRLRSSFDTLKELNDSLKKQLNDVSEENKKMEIQAKRVQARLDNLQRKYAFMTVQRLKANSHAAQETKSLKQEKAPVSKTCKVPLNAQVYELLTVFMDWISDYHLSKLRSEEPGTEGDKLQLQLASQRSDVQERCVKLLPAMTEQLQWMPCVSARLHEPFVKFIYWSLRQLEAGTLVTIDRSLRLYSADGTPLDLVLSQSFKAHMYSFLMTLKAADCLNEVALLVPLVTQSPAFDVHEIWTLLSDFMCRNSKADSCYPLGKHSTMTATLRRLGEDIFRGVVTKGTRDTSLEHSLESKPKTAAFFRSSHLPLRFLSTLIVLKTVTQADYLAQAFDSLCLDLKTDEGKTLFLEYQAVPVILSHLRISSKGLLPNVIDSLLQMTVESKSLQPFLEACSNTLFFRTCSVLLRTPKLDLQILEKLSIILQKLSKIKSNKKLFELFTLHLMLQEIQRTTHPEHAFLCINLNSTLFNLGLTKCGSLAAAAGH